MLDNWISTKDRLPEAGQLIMVSFMYGGIFGLKRQYHVLDLRHRESPYSLTHCPGKLLFGSDSECDYWQPLEPIKD